jgi:hypothetical protein
MPDWSAAATIAVELITFRQGITPCAHVYCIKWGLRFKPEF